MRTLAIATLLFFYYSSFSQTLTPVSKNIKAAFDKVSVDVNNQKFQSDYIRAFPSDTKTFLSVFQPDQADQLYSDSWKYLNALDQCAATYPKAVISKCIDIGKNLTWDADAVGHLQHMCVNLAAKHPALFANKYNTLTSREQDSLINFLADVENHKSYRIYQDLIDKLNSIKQTGIVNKLESARTKRENSHDH